MIQNSARTRPVGIMLVAGFIGLVVGAAIVAGAWLLFGGSDSAGIGGRSGPPITAPARIGDFARFADAQVNQQDRAKATVDRVREWDRQNTQRLSTTYGGAAATAESYADDRLESQFHLLVVRAPSPFPQFVPFADPKELGLAKPTQEVLMFGDVACRVSNQPSTSDAGGQDVAYVLSCLRTGGALTVQIQDVSGDLGKDAKRVAGLVDQAWDAVR